MTKLFLLLAAAAALVAGASFPGDVSGTKKNGTNHSKTHHANSNKLVPAPAHLLLHGFSYEELLGFQHSCLKRMHKEKTTTDRGARSKAGKTQRKSACLKRCVADHKAAKAAGRGRLLHSCSSKCQGGGGGGGGSSSSNRTPAPQDQSDAGSRRRLQFGGLLGGEGGLLGDGVEPTPLSAFSGLTSLLSTSALHGGGKNAKRLVTEEEKKKIEERKHKMHKMIVFAHNRCPRNSTYVKKAYAKKYGGDGGGGGGNDDPDDPNDDSGGDAPDYQDPSDQE